MPLYEELYGRKCRPPFCWSEVYERKFIGPEIVQQIGDKVKIINHYLMISSDKQNLFDELKRCELNVKLNIKFN